MRAIMRQIQVEQEKAYVSGQASRGDSAEVHYEAPDDFVWPPSPVAPTNGASSDQPPIVPEVVLKPPHPSVAKRKCPSEGGARSSIKKRTKHLAQKKLQGERSNHHLIEFPGDCSTRKVLAEMILATEGFFFPQDEKWLQSLSSNKFYEMTISCLYRVSFLVRYFLIMNHFAHIFYSFKGC